MSYRDYDYDANTYVEVIAEFDGEMREEGPYRVQKYVYREGWYATGKSFSTAEGAQEYARKKSRKYETRYRVIVDTKENNA